MAKVYLPEWNTASEDRTTTKTLCYEQSCHSYEKTLTNRRTIQRKMWKYKTQNFRFDKKQIREAAKVTPKRGNGPAAQLLEKNWLGLFGSDFGFKNLNTTSVRVPHVQIMKIGQE